LEGEVWVNAAKAGNEIVFEGPNGSFCSVATVDVWRDYLVVHCLFAHCMLECSHVGAQRMLHCLVFAIWDGGHDCIGKREGV
jgi:hypothetical protein